MVADRRRHAALFIFCEMRFLIDEECLTPKNDDRRGELLVVT